jgi:starch-binding outer membrane protein, SusD/RagB family
MRKYLRWTALALAVAAACTEITTLKQENPGQVDASSLYQQRNAQLLVNGAIADFECAFSRYVLGSAILGDELINAISNTANFDYDRRTLLPTQPYGTASCASALQQPGVYTVLSTARGSADTILARLEVWADADVPNRQKLIGQSAAYAGYSLTLLGEAMCTAAVNVGPEMTPAQLFAEAKLRFDKAITAATTAADNTTLNFARLGRARAQLDLGGASVAAAAADAALIPVGFVVNMSTDAINARRQNAVFVHNSQNNQSSVDPSFRGLTIGTPPVNDPRVLVTNTGRNGTAAVQIWTPNKFPNAASVIAIAKYAEAQLIIAEERANANDLTGAQTAINAARSQTAGLPAYSAAGQTQAQVQAQVTEERRREMFLEGHRFGDVRRLNLPLVPAPGTAYINGGVYGNQNCFPLPDVERINNPSIPKAP